MTALPASIDDAQALLAGAGYVAGRGLSTVVFLALKLGRPLFLEGEAGVGKTEIAKALAQALGRRLIRLQCYEGLDAASAVYEWNFPAQMVAIRTAEAEGSADRHALTEELFSERFLIRRPLLEAMQPQAGGPPVLLIDELDRTDEPFEAFLLEALSDFQVTIPELGTIHAAEPPIVILTSNRTREVHDALKRRCLYHWVDYPDFERELAILRARAPEATAALSREVVAFVQRLRGEDLFKKPGVAETIDWAKCLVALDAVAAQPAGDRRHPRRAAQVPGRHRPAAGLRSEAHPRRGAGRGGARDPAGGARRRVTGLLRAEGGAMALAMAFIAWDLGTPWWLAVIVLAAPDLSFAAYAFGPRAGAAVYNAAHTYLGPAVLAAVGLLSGSMTTATVGALWALHIGADRALGFGLKYPTGVRRHPLGRVGRR